MNAALLLLLSSRLVAVRSEPSALRTSTFEGTVSSADGGLLLPLANVTAQAGCTPATQLTDRRGRFQFYCDSTRASVHVWARQYLAANASLVADQVAGLKLSPRPIDGFPAKDWRFEGWAVEAQTGPVPGTSNGFAKKLACNATPSLGYLREGSGKLPKCGPANFLAHPSVIETESADPNKRFFMITTASTHAGPPSWTQGYYSADAINFVPIADFVLRSFGDWAKLAGCNENTGSFSARMLWVEPEPGTSEKRRLLMLIHVDAQPRTCRSYRGPIGRGFPDPFVLENKNLEDPGNVSEWRIADGTYNGQLSLSGVPASAVPGGTSKCGTNTTCLNENIGHQDFRLHAFIKPWPTDASGVGHRFWLLAVPGAGTQEAGRLAFVADTLAGPFQYAGYTLTPSNDTLRSWPGDLLMTSQHTFFVTEWGKLYTAPSHHLLGMQPLLTTSCSANCNSMLTVPGPKGAWDDLYQIEFTFLVPVAVGERVYLYFASYSNETGSPSGVFADYGYKQAIGILSCELTE